MAVHTCRVPWNYIHWSGYWCKGSTCTIKTMHNKLKKKWQNPLFQSSFTLFFCIYPRVQGQSHGLFVSRRLEKSKCNILLGQDAQSRQLSLTEKDRKQSPNLFWLQRGCKLYTYLDFRSRFFQILAKYS